MLKGAALLQLPREFPERCYSIRHWTEMPPGGHFPALEQPEMLVKDVREFTRRFR